MFSASDFSDEIRNVIEGGLADERVLPTSWIVQTVLERHPLPGDWQGPDRDFEELCRYGHVRVEVRKKLREFTLAKDEEESDQAARQPRLPGFDHLQRAYLCRRNGEPAMVPIGKMTELELQRKRNGLRTMARGCHAHADEIDRYLAQREASAPEVEAVAAE